MKLILLISLGLVALTAARPDTVLDLDLEDLHHNQDIDSGEVITGSYSWTSPEGEEFFVKYIADDDGYRVLESNAVPADAGGRADGQQVPFDSLEDDDDK